MSKDLSSPSPFLALPTEIRCLIYEEIFASSSQVDIELPTVERKIHFFTSVPSNRTLPAILLACKCIRTETLPLFFSTTPVAIYAYNVTLFDIPSPFLTHARTLILKGWHSWSPTWAQAPALQRLIIEDVNDTQPWETVYFASQIQDAKADEQYLVNKILQPCAHHLDRIKMLSRPEAIRSDVEILLHARFAGDFASEVAIIDFHAQRVREWQTLKLGRFPAEMRDWRKDLVPEAVNWVSSWL